MERWKR